MNMGFGDSGEAPGAGYPVLGAFYIGDMNQRAF